MMNITYLDSHTLPGVELLFDFPHHSTMHGSCVEADTLSALAEQNIVITNKVPLTRAHFEKNPQLKMVAVAATGYNHVDIQAAKEHGVVVQNVSSYSTTSVVEHSLMMLLSLAHRLPEYSTKAISGEWQNSAIFTVNGSPYYEVKGKTLAIVGKGETGRGLAGVAEALGMRVIFAERKSSEICRDGYIPFFEALNQADAVSMHCPLNENTKGMIDVEEIQQMKSGAILLNLGRGGLVDEAALADALISGKLSGAGLDVLSSEPPRGGESFAK